MSEEQTQSGKKFHPGFSKDVEAILGVYQLGGCTYVELRVNLRKAGLDLDERHDRLPEPELTMHEVPTMEDAA